jgi:rhodanese-related sulfurtransferase
MRTVGAMKDWSGSGFIETASPATGFIETASPATGGPAIDRYLAKIQRSLDRVGVDDLAGEMAAGALVVDTRPFEQRSRDGELPGAVVVDRNVLEWRLDPTSPHRLPEVTDAQQRVILVCHEGYSSSLAADTLRQLGLNRATDLIGGFVAWSERRLTDAGP